MSWARAAPNCLAETSVRWFIDALRATRPPSWTSVLIISFARRVAGSGTAAWRREAAPGANRVRERVEARLRVRVRLRMEIECEGEIKNGRWE